MASKCTLKNVNVFADKHEAFVCNNTLTGQWEYNVYFGGSKVGDDMREKFRNHMINGVDNFVVRSYDTPIAIWNKVNGWIKTDEKYSVTTSRHMTALNIWV